MWMAAKIKTPQGATIDAVKSRVHITDVFRFMTPMFRIGLLVLRRPSHDPSSGLAGVLAHMDLLAMLVELPLQGFHRRCRVPGQPRSANRKVFVATGALAVQPRFVVLGDLKMWLFHASSMAQSASQFQMAKIQTAPTTYYQSCCFPLVRNSHDHSFPMVNPQTHFCAHRFLLSLLDSFVPRFRLNSAEAASGSRTG
jgi:hypothetical protein